MGNFDGVIMSVLNNRRAAKKDPKKKVMLFGSSDSSQQDDDKPKDPNDVFTTGTDRSLARRFGSTNKKRIEDQM